MKRLMMAAGALAIALVLGLSACQAGNSALGTWSSAELGIKFELADKGVAKLFSGDEPMVGTWSQTEKTVNVTFDNETIGGTIDGDTLSLTADGETKAFVREKK